MSKRCLNPCAVILVSVLSVLAQDRIVKHLGHPTDQELPNKRLVELLRHPTFVTLRLLSSPKDPSREKPSDTPAPYKEKDWIGFQLFIAQNSSENVTIWNELSSYYQYRPELLRDGDILAYTKEAQESVRSAETRPPSGSSAPLTLEPGREYDSDRVNLKDWYETLRPGRYQLTVRKRFVSDGDWVQSNPVIFEVQPRKPGEPIPDNVSVRLAPSGLQPHLDGKRFRLESDARVTVYVVNNSKQRLKVNVVDLYYGNRLQLFKNAVLLPYLEETTKLIRSKDENPQHVDTAPDFFLDQQTTSGLQELRLSDWYRSLTPGVYQLINRRRFEIDGPWTPDSVPLLFEIPAK